MNATSGFLLFFFSLSFALMCAQPGPINDPKKAEVRAKRGPSTAHKFFGVLKDIANIYMVMGIGAMVFCGYLWLVKEVNTPERIKQMTDQQDSILLALNNLQTPRDHLRAFPQIAKVCGLEILKEIDLATFISAGVVASAAVASVIFAGAQALT